MPKLIRLIFLKYFQKISKIYQNFLKSGKNFQKISKY